MKIIVFGADGFIGRNVCEVLEKDHKVTRASRKKNDKTGYIQVDLTDTKSINNAIKTCNPDVVVNCAGIVDTSMDTDLNILFTKNILGQAAKFKSVIKKVVICGSAGEYGVIEDGELPVDENTPLRAQSGYGLSKLNEEKLALEFGAKNGLNVIVLRIFNPIGINMAERFLVMRMIKQLDEYRKGDREAVEISRLDAKRDYVSVMDIAAAFKAIIERPNNFHVYNVGSSNSTSNGKLLDLIIENSFLNEKPRIVETSDTPEPLFAIQADTTRMNSDLGWSASYNIEDVIKEICLDESRR